MDERIEMIQLDLIEPHPANRRVGGFDQAKLEQLAESIKAVGVQQPAVVRKIERPVEQKDGSGALYQLVAGERRWRASRLAGKESLPCIVRELDDVTALKIQTIENLQRDDVHPLDEADGYSQLITGAGYTVETIASEVGKSASYIYQRMKLSALTDEAKKLFVDNKITAGHAILIARLGPEQQREIVSEGLFERNWQTGEDEAISVRDLDDYIHNEIMLDMSNITWKLDNADLVPEAGSCAECPKRTGYQPEVFADVCKNEKSAKKKDYCTDRECFTRKQKRIVNIKREELKDEDIIQAADSYFRDLPKGAVSNYGWTECKKKDEGAKKVLIVAGNSPGRVTYGKLNTNESYSYQKSPEQKEKEKKERQALKAEEEKRSAKADAVLQTALENDYNLPLEALRVCIEKIWHYLPQYDLCSYICKHEGWITKSTEYDSRVMQNRINEMSESELYELMLRIAMGGEIRIQQYYRPETKAIDALMKVYNVKLSNAKKAKEKIA